MPERQRLGRHGDRAAPRGVRHRRDRAEVLDDAEEVRVADDHAGGSGVEHPLERRAIDAAVGAERDLLALEAAEPLEIGAHDLPVLRRQRSRDEHAAGLRASNRLRHQHGFGGRRRAVVHARVGDLEAESEAIERLELERRLQRALAHLGLVRRVRRRELAPLDHVIDDRRNEMRVGAGAGEAEEARRHAVRAGQLAKRARGVGLTEPVGNVERGLPAQVRRNVRDQVVEGSQADRRQASRRRRPRCAGCSASRRSTAEARRYSSSSSSSSASISSSSELFELLGLAFLFDVVLVLLRRHQVLDLGGVAHLDADQPRVAVGIVVDQLRRWRRGRRWPR